MPAAGSGSVGSLIVASSGGAPTTLGSMSLSSSSMAGKGAAYKASHLGGGYNGPNNSTSPAKGSSLGRSGLNSSGGTYGSTLGVNRGDLNMKGAGNGFGGMVSMPSQSGLPGA